MEQAAELELLNALFDDDTFAWKPVGVNGDSVVGECARDHPLFRRFRTDPFYQCALKNHGVSIFPRADSNRVSIVVRVPSSDEEVETLATV